MSVCEVKSLDFIEVYQRFFAIGFKIRCGVAMKKSVAKVRVGGAHRRPQPRGALLGCTRGPRQNVFLVAVFQWHLNEHSV